MAKTRDILRIAAPAEMAPEQWQEIADKAVHCKKELAFCWRSRELPRKPGEAAEYETVEMSIDADGLPAKEPFVFVGASDKYVYFGKASPVWSIDAYGRVPRDKWPGGVP